MIAVYIIDGMMMMMVVVEMTMMMNALMNLNMKVELNE